MIAKTALLLTIAGFAAAQNSVTVPRWISADKHGYGYAMSYYYNGTYSYDASLSFSWDFDYNCMRSYAYSWSDYRWAESSYCNNYAKTYKSWTATCDSEYVGYQSLETAFTGYINDFTISWGTGHEDPVWSTNSNYRVLEHKTEWHYLYLDSTTNVVEFIVDGTPTSRDIVYYFPEGLVWDKTVSGVYDFELRYGTCPNQASVSNFLTAAKKLHHQTPTMPALGSKPAKKAAGGVKSLFKHTTSAKSFAAAMPSKATFVVNKEEVAAAPKPAFTNLFRQAASSAPVAQASPKMASFKNFVQGQSLYTRTEKVNWIFQTYDSNYDGYLNKSEVKRLL